MDYEKKYKEALEWMQSLYDGLHGATKEEAEHYFTELKESEDEKIRKAIIAYISHDQHCGVSNADMIAWLEKQDKKKNTRKRETDDAYLQGICDAKHEIEKQGEKKLTENAKKLDVDNVWLQNYISNVTCLVNQFSNSSNIGKDLKGGEE